jgi:RNA polymerase sigma factor (TIGR02999 family)
MVDEPEKGAPHQVTRILGAVQAGDVDASAELLPLVYEDLRRLAAARMARLAPGQTLQATELVHEAYMRLVGSTDPGWQGRAHFFGAAARAMRNVVVDHLRRKGSLKRGAKFQRVGDQTAAGLSADGPDDDVLALEESLALFERDYPRKAEVVTLRFYGNLTAEEIAEVMSVTSRTVERDWRFARAWLNGRLSEREDEP